MNASNDIPIPPPSISRPKRNAVAGIVVMILVIVTVLAVVPGMALVSQQTELNSPGELSTVESASYIIFKDDESTLAKNGTTGIIDFMSTNATYVIQQAIDNTPSEGGVVYLKSGTFQGHYSDSIRVRSNVALIGSGQTITSIDSITIVVIGNNVIVSNLAVIGTPRWAGIYVSGDHDLNNITLNNLYVSAGGSNRANDPQGIMFYAAAGCTVSNVLVQNVRAERCTSHGFIQQTHPIGAIENVTYLDCVSNANGGANGIWGAGFVVADDHTVVRNICYRNCVAIDSYEAGFHTQSNGASVENVVFSDCVASGNGIRKSSPTFGDGFLIAGRTSLTNCLSVGNSNDGYEINDHQVSQKSLSNCVSEDNTRGFAIFHAVPGGSTSLDDCRDFGSVRSFVVMTDATYYGKVIVNNCESHDAQQAIYHYYAANVIYNNFWADKPTGGGAYPGAVLLSIEGIASKNIRFHGLVVGAPALANDYLVRVIAGSNITVSGEIVMNRNSGPALHISNNARDVFVHDLTIHTSSEWGISASPSVVNARVWNVYIDDNYAGNLVNGITGGGALLVELGSVRVIGASGADCAAVVAWS